MGAEFRLLGKHIGVRPGTLPYRFPGVGDLVNKKGRCDEEEGYGEPYTKHVLANIADRELPAPIFKIDCEESSYEGHWQEYDSDDGKDHNRLPCICISIFRN